MVEDLKNGNVAVSVKPDETIVLSERDFARFVHLIVNPPAPSKRLRLLMANTEAKHGIKD